MEEFNLSFCLGAVGARVSVFGTTEGDVEMARLVAGTVFGRHPGHGEFEGFGVVVAGVPERGHDYSD